MLLFAAAPRSWRRYESPEPRSGTVGEERSKAEDEPCIEGIDERDAELL
jgi:hypothetical protein